MNAFGMGNWDMTGGSDLVHEASDYILAQNAHSWSMQQVLPHWRCDPRPPLFSWSMAVGAMLLQPFIDNPDGLLDMLSLPALYVH